MSSTPGPSHERRLRWRVKPCPPAADELGKGLSLHPVVARLLALRGIEDAEVAGRFLRPRLGGLGDPFEIPGMRAAVDRLLQAVDQRQTVVLYGDYDVDGVTSMALLRLTLAAYGISALHFLPHRMEEGYGMSMEGLARCFEQHGRPGLLVALDCGTTSLAETAWLREQSVDCIIVDHHELAAAGTPECAALVNPKLGERYHYLCTAGLVFKLAHALMKARRAPNFELKDTLDLVALGTVADLVPLVEENRILVQHGLDLIGRTRRVGLRALKEVAGMDGFVQTHHVGYRLGPRLNAAGRLDTALAALDLLLAVDPAWAKKEAQMLDERNRERQTVENRVLVEAEAQVAALGKLDEIPGIVLGSRNWHPGVIGIVASRIVRRWHRPAILIAIDENGVGKGSGRSIAGLSLVDAIHTCNHLLLKGGGHAMAAGISIEEDKVDAFREAFLRHARQTLTEDDLTPTLDLDAELSLKDVAGDFLSQYQEMEPFGMQNPEPLFLCRGVTPRLPGRVMKEKHLRVTLCQGRASHDAMYFNAPLQDLPPPPWDVAMRVQRNSYRGAMQWQIFIEKVRAAE